VLSESLEVDSISADNRGIYDAECVFARDVEPQVEGLSRIIGNSPVMRDLCRRIERIAVSNVSVLITGESGTGKELVAQTLHDLSDRRKAPFVAVNCGAVPATLVEAELFGFERGSFTGAIRSQAGYFERAGAGSIFLDEAAEMPLEMQVKLLRALENRRVTRVGGDREIEVHARVIAATNRTLADAVGGNRLREDLLYRLAVFHLELPPLRHRGADVELLAADFLERLNRTAGTRRRLSMDSMAYLREHSWPGNVRELHNTVQRAFILADDTIDLRQAASFGPRLDQPVSVADDCIQVRPGMSLSEIERIVIKETLSSCAGNKTRTAAVLGISVKTLYNKLNEYRALQ
jgi:transcriptional regulator with PAS, ATPase and Fis domain